MGYLNTASNNPAQGITVVPREIEDDKTMVMQFFFNAEGVGVGGNKVHCGLCENGELLSFCFPTIPTFQNHVVITRVVIGVAS